MPIMSQPHLSIIGAGLSGLVLGRCLSHKGIASVLFEREAAPSSGHMRHAYGITLHAWAYQPLLKHLDLDERSFRDRVAVDAAVGGVGRVGDSDLSSAGSESGSFRANRSRLERLLGEGLDIRWEHSLADVKRHQGNANVLHFSNGQEIRSSLVVGADGPHSQVRKSIFPTTTSKVLPFAVYNGKRRLDRKTFEEHFRQYMDGANVIERRNDQVLMQITINDSTNDSVSISYTYSRPAEQPDPIFNPDRPLSGATEIPDEIYDEIASLTDLHGPFKEVFDVERMRSDRLLNWLMRSVLVQTSELHAAADEGIVLLGDAVHATPILGGHGANAAIRDAVGLAESILEHGTAAGSSRFYEPPRFETWRSYVEAGEAQLAKMHEQAKPNL